MADHRDSLVPLGGGDADAVCLSEQPEERMEMSSLDVADGADGFAQRVQQRPGAVRRMQLDRPRHRIDHDRWDQSRARQLR